MKMVILNRLFVGIALHIVCLTFGLSCSFHSEEFQSNPKETDSVLLASRECVSYIDSVTKIRLFNNVDLEPSFPGGPPASARYINRNLKYPDMDDEENFQFSVVVSFIVQSDGTLADIHIDGKRGIDRLSSFEKMVLGLYEGMPSWIPAKCNGREVSVRVRRPLSVHLETN